MSRYPIGRVILDTTRQCLLAKTAMVTQTPISILGADYLITHLELRSGLGSGTFTGCMELAFLKETPGHVQPPAAQLAITHEKAAYEPEVHYPGYPKGARG